MSPSTGTSVCSLLPSRGSRFSPVPHAHRYYEVVRLLPARPGRLRSPSTARYLPLNARSFPGPVHSTSRGLARCGQVRHTCSVREETGGLPGSWGIPVNACPGLGTPAAPNDLAVPVVRMLSSARLTASTSATVTISELNPRGPRPRCLRFTPTSRPARGKARYRPARYGFGRAGLSPAGLFREVSVNSCRLPPLPGLAWRDSLDFHGPEFA